MKDMIRLIVLLVAFSVLLYPTFSSYLNEKNSSKVVSHYDEDYIDEKLRNMYKNLHYTYAEIALNYGNRIHYNLV